MHENLFQIFKKPKGTMGTEGSNLELILVIQEICYILWKVK